MKELAKQELINLEAQHPTKYQFLKLELKEFISLLDEQEQQQSLNQQQLFHQPAVTEESSNRKREREWEKDDAYSKRRKRATQGISSAMQKAEACLQQIQTLKSFFGSSNH